MKHRPWGNYMRELMKVFCWLCLGFFFCLFFILEHCSDCVQNFSGIKTPKLGQPAVWVSSPVIGSLWTLVSCVLFHLLQWDFTQVWRSAPAAQIAGQCPRLGCDGSRSSTVPNRTKEEKASVAAIKLCGFEINSTLWGIYNCGLFYYIPRK